MGIGSTDDGMTTLEVQLVERLGVPRRVLKEWRQDMKKGRDWMIERGKVAYTPDGVKKLEELLGLREVPEGFYFQDKEFKKVRVVRNWPHNKRILTCEDEDGVRMDVRVRNNENFRPMLTTGEPMELTVRKDGEGWTLEGRCPRYAGRW